MATTIYLASGQYKVDETAASVITKLTAAKTNGYCSLAKQTNGLYVIDTTFNTTRSFFFNVNQVQDLRVT